MKPMLRQLKRAPRPRPEQVGAHLATVEAGEAELIDDVMQTLNYDKWFDGSVETDPKPTDLLLPFHYDKEGHLYDSNMVRRWWDFGYHYKILEGVIGKDGQVNRLDLIRLRVRLAVLYGHTRGLVRSIPTTVGRKNEYVLNVIYDCYALDGCAYTIHFFLGAPPESEVRIQYHKYPSHMVFTFSSKIADEDDAPGQCANCAKQNKAGVLSGAQLHLTSPIIKHALDLERVLIRDITREHYLKDMSHWRAVDISGQTIGIPTHLPRTKIFAMDGTGRHEEETSEYGRYQPVWGATAGKPGGAAEADKSVLHVVVED